MKTINLSVRVESDSTGAQLREAICSVLAGMEEHYISHEVMPDKSEIPRANVKFRIAEVRSGNCRVDAGH